MLLPILGRPYGEALEQGEIELNYDRAEGSFSAWYFEHRLPIRPHRYGEILTTVVTAADAADDRPGRRAARAGRHAIAARARPRTREAPALKAATRRDRGRRRRSSSAGLRLSAAAARDRAKSARCIVCSSGSTIASRIGGVAASEINYRRFFDINDSPASGSRTRAPFDAVHRLVARADRRGQAAGPAARPYRRAARPGAILPPPAAPDRERSAAARRPFYVVVEKILADGEPMPRFPASPAPPATNGSTSSRACWSTIAACRLERHLARRSAGDSRDFDEMLEARQARVLENHPGERIHRAGAAAGAHRRRAITRTRDYALDRLRAALEAVRARISRLSHLCHRRRRIRARTARRSSGRSRRRARDWFGSDVGIFDFLRDALTLDLIAAGRAGYSARAGAPLRPQGAAVHRARDGEVAGGHRLLPLPPAARAQRGRRRSRAAGTVGRRLPPIAWPARASMSRMA